MNAKTQVLFDKGRPVFVVLPYEDYLTLTRGKVVRVEDDEFIPFRMGDYIKNPIRVLRVEAAMRQDELARLLGVSQGYVSRIEGRGFMVGDALLKRVRQAVRKRRGRARR